LVIKKTEKKIIIIKKLKHVNCVNFPKLVLVFWKVKKVSVI